VNRIQVLVIGGGHAGVEAAVAASAIGCRVAIVTPSHSKVALMSCNPAIGGIAKGTLVREVDGLGGVIAESADSTALQFRMLNTRKGPAVWGPRVQTDVYDYCAAQIEKLKMARVVVVEGVVVKLLGPVERIQGVMLSSGEEIKADAFVLAAGTFLGAMLHRGSETWPGGRNGDISAIGLDNDLRERKFHVKRFKTGTSPRVLRKSIDTSALESQEAHDMKFRFSWASSVAVKNREQCWLTRTTPQTEDIVKNSLSRSPLYSGRITGKGPRYCPSFEDKVTKFPERSGHPVHVEPMGLASRTMYLNGLSTSMPPEIQEQIVKSLPGFGNAVISTFGYSVEYSCFETGAFDRTLRLTNCENLYASGQLLGTTGYEEAAATGLLAGANAARAVLGMQTLFPDRISSYLGVMVDDLVSKGAEEPYRLFSSRSENRLHLRQDNADRRVHPFASDLGTLSEGRKKDYMERDRRYRALRILLSEQIRDGSSIEDLCRRPEVSPETIEGLINYSTEDINGREILAVAVLDIKYSGYISRAERRHTARKRYGSASLKSIQNFQDVQSISIEAREALNLRRPDTLSDAEAIPSVRQADLDSLVLHLMKESVSRET
jgi:tRNA uridine 5-carboxymethylaminomethyl modification enzyme